MSHLLFSSSAKLHLTLLSFAALFPTFARSYSWHMERFWTCSRDWWGTEASWKSWMSHTSFKKLWWKFSFPNGLFTFPDECQDIPHGFSGKLLNSDEGQTGKIQPGYAVDMTCIKLGRLSQHRSGMFTECYVLSVAQMRVVPSLCVSAIANITDIGIFSKGFHFGHLRHSQARTVCINLARLARVVENPSRENLSDSVLKARHRACRCVVVVSLAACVVSQTCIKAFTPFWQKTKPPSIRLLQMWMDQWYDISWCNRNS